MVLRYHWGLSVGHIYASTGGTEGETQLEMHSDNADSGLNSAADRLPSSLPDGEDFMDCNDSGTEDSGSGMEDSDSDKENTEELMALDEMYAEGPSWMDDDI